MEVAVAPAGPCANNLHLAPALQTNNHAGTSSLTFLQAGCFSWRPTNSVKALKAKQEEEEEANIQLRIQMLFCFYVECRLMIYSLATHIFLLCSTTRSDSYFTQR